MSLSFAHSHEEFSSLIKRKIEPEAGSYVSFLGTVRKFNQGKVVLALEYEAHVALACSLFLELEAQALERHGALNVLAVHRLGPVGVSEPSVLIEVGAPHRHQSFMAARFLIDELKKTLPIFKKELYVDGSWTWEHHCS